MELDEPIRIRLRNRLLASFKGQVKGPSRRQFDGPFWGLDLLSVQPGEQVRRRLSDQLEEDWDLINK